MNLESSTSGRGGKALGLFAYGALLFGTIFGVSHSNALKQGEPKNKFFANPAYVRAEDYAEAWKRPTKKQVNEEKTIEYSFGTLKLPVKVKVTGTEVDTPQPAYTVCEYPDGSAMYCFVFGPQTPVTKYVSPSAHQYIKNFTQSWESLGAAELSKQKPAYVQEVFDICKKVMEADEESKRLNESRNRVAEKIDGNKIIFEQNGASLEYTLDKGSLELLDQATVVAESACNRIGSPFNRSAYRRDLLGNADNKGKADGTVTPKELEEVLNAK